QRRRDMAHTPFGPEARIGGAAAAIERTRRHVALDLAPTPGLVRHARLQFILDLDYECKIRSGQPGGARGCPRQPGRGAMRAGRHFLQIPGPTNVPDRVLRAMDRPTIDHRGPDFGELGRRALDGMKRIVRTERGEVVIYPASGTGAWEGALVNTLSPGDQ